MIPDKLKQLILLLTTKTKEKKAKWNKGSGASQFKLLLANGISMTIAEWSNNNWNDGYEVVIFNGNGDAIQKYMSSDETTAEDMSVLKDLHTAASNEYYKVEETMDALLTSVNSQEVIGNIEPPVKPKDEDDDLPF